MAFNRSIIVGGVSMALSLIIVGLMISSTLSVNLHRSLSSPQSSSLPSSHDSPIVINSRHIRSSESVSTFQAQNNIPNSSSTSSIPMTSLFRSKRAPWEWMIDALKCTMKIMSGKLSRYHNNKVMCCSLWIAKKFLKQSAEESCERPEQSIKVFDEIITEQLIYSDFTKAMLGDPNLDCSRYPESSSECDAMFYMIVTTAIIIVLALIAMIIGLVVSMWMCYRWRRSYYELLRAKGVRDNHSMNSFDEKAKFLGKPTAATRANPNNTTKQKLQNMLNGGGSYLLPKKNSNKFANKSVNKPNGTNMGYVNNRSNSGFVKATTDGQNSLPDSELELSQTRNTTPTTDGRSSSASTETSTATA